MKQVFNIKFILTIIDLKNIQKIESIFEMFLPILYDKVPWILSRI
ncbi:hypothetical protein LEP1GSC074_2419 [Leptospira noguchii str. Hook]|uniref:Uncharacterized protein n=1 Tax=Leptospira noguchii serovar Autumnalis str. ZUN142 TaxID=1085540 RepID=M6UUM0_9LEPT|nr:hypothetical protein LEP1GSC041_0957 [Leptospira noguchii str. 2006001870]EMI63396.1 hypothetical protein LEP1GSC072_0112 [Leptospira noguchii str. Bonito]EMO40963.1 hypothetical protein LEP1GSC186_4437 [Leptospira noguchii serovar Autumnalis str. ZUN142]EMS81817.1 hypothetical protein LEP1GSC074_2419 [Leptospira noguchii str. Hook]